MTDPFASVSLDQLRKRSSIKWRHYAPDVLPMWVAEMDVELATPVKEALLAAVASGDTGYPGTNDFTEAFVDFASARWQWQGLDAGHVRPVAGVIPGYVDALLIGAGAGGTVIVTPPVYPPFYSYVREAGLTVVEAPLRDMRLDIEAIDRAFAEATRAGQPAALLLCNPHNPGGTVHTAAELAALAEVALRHGGTVVSDEIHAPLVYSDASFTPYLSVDPRGMALHAASKAWNLAGLPAALLVFGADAADAKAAYGTGPHHWPSHLGALAGAAAYREGGAWLQDVLTALEHRRQLLGTLLAEHAPTIGYQWPQATYLAWLDCTALELDDDPAAVFLERGRIGLNSGPTFGSGGAGHVRLNFAASAATLEEGVRRIAAATAGE